MTHTTPEVETFPGSIRALGVYAHPDDEVFAWGGTAAQLADRGVRVALAVATGGEAGEIVNPDLQGKVDLEDLPALRQEELDCSAFTLGITEVIRLGYRDSGMAGSATADRPDAFVNVPLEDVVARLVALLRSYRPHLIFTFDQHGGYGHPDHIAVHHAVRLAFDAAGDPSRYPDLLPPWTPLKLYFVVITRETIVRTKEAFEACGLEFSFGTGIQAIERQEIPGYAEADVTTMVDVRSTIHRKVQAFRCYQTQVRPDFFYLRAPDEVLKGALGREYFVLAGSRVATTLPEHDPLDGIPPDA